MENTTMNAGMFTNTTPYMNYGVPYMGVQPQQNIQPPQMNQLLTPEEMAQLKQNNTGFNINVSPEEITKSLCTHKQNGNYSIIENEDGSVTCTICGETFTPRFMDTEALDRAINEISDIFNTIKLCYTDIPTELGRQYMPLQPLVKKLKPLYKIAMNNFNKYTNISQQVPGNQYGNVFANLSMVTSGVGYPYYAQPQMAQQYGYTPYPQPMVSAQPAFDPNQMYYSPATAATQNIPMTPNVAPNPFSINGVGPAPMTAPQQPAPVPVAPQTQMPQPNSYGFNVPQQTVAPVPGTMPNQYRPGMVNTPAPVAPAPVPSAPATPSTDVTVTDTIKV